MSSFDNSKCGTDRHLSDMTSSAGNCGMVENTVKSLSDSITGKQLLQASVMCNGTNDLIGTEGPAKPSTSVDNQMMDSVAALMHLPDMTELLIPMNNTSQYGSVVHIRVFSTELANCAAESVGTGRYDSIIDFHRYYYAAQNSRNTAVTAGYIPATQSQLSYYPEYHPSQPGDVSTAVGYTQAGIEQWVRQQNASRQKQEQMAASPVYSGHLYRVCDEVPESGYRYWSGHQKPVTSVNPARVHMSSSADFVEPSRYDDASMNVHHCCNNNCRISDDSLTVEQRQQRQNKMGRLQVIRQMLTADQQAPASFMQSQVAPGVGWNGVPCDSDMYAGSYNSGSQILNTGYAPSAVRHHSHPPSWDMMTTAQRKWYCMQQDYQMNQMGMQTDMYHSQPADFCNSSVRYFEPPDERRQLSSRAVRTHTMCECTPVYPQGCTHEVGMSQHHMPPSGMYGFTQVGIQPNYGCQQQMNRSDEFVNQHQHHHHHHGEFVNGNYGMPVVGNRKLTYHMPRKGPADGSQNWNCGENVIQQQLMAAAGPQQFGAQSQQVTLTHQLNSSDCTGQSIVAEPVNSAPVQVPVVEARRRQSASSKKRKNNSSSFTAQPDSKSKKLDSGAGELASAATWSGTLMNITSASLAHLAEGVENISAVMQQTVQHGGPFQSVQRPSDHVDGSADENANFIYGGDSLQIQAAAAGLHPVEQKTAHESDCTSITSSVSAFQTSNNYSRCSVAAVSSSSSVHSNASTTGIDVVVMSKAPYTISYRPTGISSGDSVSNVDVRNAAAFCHNATPRTMQQSNVARHMLSADSVSFSRRQIPSSEDFSLQHQHAMTPCYKNPTDATKVDQHAAATDKCLSMASSVAVIQPQMMSGTQLFIAERCSESSPVLNNFVLPTGVPSSASRSPQQFHSMQHDPNYQGFALQRMPVSSNGSVPVFYSSPNPVKLNTDPSLSDSAAGGSPLSRYSQTNVGGCHQPSVSVYSRSFSQTHNATCAVQNTLPGADVVTTQM